ncbi:MAG: succinate dehydrogenase, cytochrome b556 subunit [Betaproteobacteria bacterium]
MNAFKDLPGYRWPLASIISGMHRISGLILFLLMPFIIWMFDTSISSEISFFRFTHVFSKGVACGMQSCAIPGALIKLQALGLIWAYLHHFIAGMRHLYMDARHPVSKEFGQSSAIATLALSLGLTALLGAKLFGLY